MGGFKGFSEQWLKQRQLKELDKKEKQQDKRIKQVNKVAKEIFIDEFDKITIESVTTWTFYYSGQLIGMNEFKSKSHFEISKINDKVKADLLPLLDRLELPKLKWIKLKLFHNTRYDIDNLAAWSKLFCDQLTIKGIIKDDNKEGYKLLSIEPTDLIPKGYLKIKLIGEKELKKTS